MSKPTITAERTIERITKRTLCQPEDQASTSPGVEVRVEFDHGDAQRALLSLYAAVESVREQILDSEVWPTPRAQGSE